ncbi:MAG: glycoside hydrolase family 15 protein [Gemmatimonadaceae bacterium]
MRDEFVKAPDAAGVAEGDVEPAGRRHADAPPPAHDRRYAPIESYGIIGDMQTVALVGLDGGIDFLCLPHFDSPTVFASLLDREKGGRFAIEPLLDEARRKQLYLPDTNVLLTRFLAESGVAEISDFMPVHREEHPSRIVRRVKTIRGEVRFRVRCAPRFDYARGRHRAEREDGGGIRFVPESGGSALRLTSDVALELHEGDAVAELTLRRGQHAAFVLEHVPPEGPSVADPHAYVARWFKETVNFWREWIGKSTYAGRWRDEVNRSALTLKLLHSRRDGAFIASPTFGLPERVGGERNWDYRYTWIRDASFTLYALIRLGLTDETKAFIGWLVGRTLAQDDPGQMQTLYGVDGRTELPEELLPHLEGYRGSSPVRVGNAASGQLQLDIYGELMDALYLYDKYGEPTSYDLWRWIASLVDWVCEHWETPDEGVWEVRSGRRHFLYSRVLCWVAVDRGLRLAEKRSFPAPVARWRAARDAIYHDVFENFWDAEEETFVGSKGSAALDASCLIMPLVRFISPTDPRWLSTLRAVERRLVEDSLVFRYTIDGPETDGLQGAEGTFSICSFWYIECLSRAGDLQKARFLFEKMLGYANHLGLYAEEVGPAGEHLGNFPQAFTHLALISAAYDLDRRLSGAGWKA